MGLVGGEVEKYYRDGRIKEIAQYCESDVINTYRVFGCDMNYFGAD
jgi:predicted PolB exonuclease-like 3'-5' exonuclease